jgi:hypothetical protein
MAHACNLSYSEGKDQEDRGSRPAQAKSASDPITTNKPDVVADLYNNSDEGGLRAYLKNKDKKAMSPQVLKGEY